MKALIHRQWREIDAEVGRVDERDEDDVVATVVVLNEGFDGLRLLIWHYTSETPDDAFEQRQSPSYWERFHDADEGAGFHVFERLHLAAIVRE